PTCTGITPTRPRSRTCWCRRRRCCDRRPGTATTWTTRNHRERRSRRLREQPAQRVTGRGCRRRAASAVPSSARAEDGAFWTRGAQAANPRAASQRLASCREPPTGGVSKPNPSAATLLLAYGSRRGAGPARRVGGRPRPLPRPPRRGVDLAGRRRPRGAQGPAARLAVPVRERGHPPHLRLRARAADRLGRPRRRPAPARPAPGAAGTAARPGVVPVVRRPGPRPAPRHRGAREGVAARARRRGGATADPAADAVDALRALRPPRRDGRRRGEPGGAQPGPARAVVQRARRLTDRAPHPRAAEGSAHGRGAAAVLAQPAARPALRAARRGGGGAADA